MSEFTEIFYTSSTGVNTIRAIKVIPEQPARAIIQIAHGVADHIDRYRDFMRFMSDNGFIVVGNDHLGHGKSIRFPIEQGFFAYENGWHHVVADMDKLRSICLDAHPNLPYIFFGHSMGSFLTRTYMIKYPNNYNASILSGTGHMRKTMIKSGFLLTDSIRRTKGARYASTLIDKIAFGSYNKCFEPNRTNFDWISSDTEQVDRYINDPLCGFIPSASLFRDMMSGIDFITDEKNISKVNLQKPVLLISGSMDPVGENGKAVERAYKAFCKAGVQDVYMKLYPGGRHEMLNEVNRVEVYNDILNWINNRI